MDVNSRTDDAIERRGSELSLRRSSLQRLGANRDKALLRLGFRTLSDLLNYEPLRSARILAAVARGLVSAPQLEHLVKDEFLHADPRAAISWPVTILHGMTYDAEQVLAAIGVKTVGDLAQLGKEAEEAVQAALEDNGFRERPSAPAQLLPGLIGSVASAVRFTTFIRDMDLHKLNFKVNSSCIVPLPISSKRKSLKYPSGLDLIFTPPPRKSPGTLADIFATQRCPVVHLGYMCDHRQHWINLGTQLGEVVHSVSLAPGESRNIALVNWRRRQLTALEERTTTKERLTATFVQNRALEEITSAVAREHQAGQTQSEANTAATAASLVGAGAVIGGVAGGITGAVVGGIIGSVEPGLGTAMGAGAGGAVGTAVGGAAGAAAGGLVYSGAQALGMIEADTEGDRGIVAEVQQRISLSTSQAASAVRSLWSTVVVEDAQAEDVEATTSNITNYNHMHALNIEYYEVLQHYLVRIEVERIQPILFLPFTFFDFSGFQFVRDYWEVVRLHIEDQALRDQGDVYFVTEEPPPPSAGPNLDPVPPEPVPPQVPKPPRLEDLEIDVLFNSLPENTNIGLDIMRGNAEINGEESEFVVQEDDMEGYEWGNRYKFKLIKRADEITAVRLSRHQHVAWDTEYHIRVHKGKLKTKNGSDTLEDLEGQTIASNRTLRGKKGAHTFEIPWHPAADFQEVDEQAQADYEKALIERAKVIGKNDIRRANYDRMAANREAFERFQQRLETLILRRRYFFTRVILNAIEPEEITQLLEALKIGHDDASNPQQAILLSDIAHTIPLGLTAGAFVLKLKRLNQEDRKQLARQRLGLPLDDVAEELRILLQYSDDTLEFFENAQRRKAMAQTDQIYVPTGGLFAEAILGRANSAEYLDMERYFNWQDSPIPHQAPTIQPVGTESRFQQGDVSVTVPPGNLQVINPVNLPDPTGLQGVLAAIQNPNIFRDMSKASELASIVGSLSALAGQMGQAASTMTGQAAQQALQAATQVGQAAAGMAQSLMSDAFTQAGGALSTITNQGAALNQARELEQGAPGPATGAAPGTPASGGGGTPAGGGAVAPVDEGVPQPNTDRRDLVRSAGGLPPVPAPQSRSQPTQPVERVVQFFVQQPDTSIVVPGLYEVVIEEPLSGAQKGEPFELRSGSQLGKIRTTFPAGVWNVQARIDPEMPNSILEIPVNVLPGVAPITFKAESSSLDPEGRIYDLAEPITVSQDIRVINLYLKPIISEIRVEREIALNAQATSAAQVNAQLQAGVEAEGSIGVAKVGATNQVTLGTQFSLSGTVGANERITLQMVFKVLAGFKIEQR